MDRIASFILGVLLASGLAAVGLLGYRAAIDVKGASRVVTVKGLAERELPADLAIWPLSFSVSGNELSAVHDEVESDGGAVLAFLGEQGFPPEAISLGAPVVTDFQTQGYNQQSPFRFKADVVATVRSEDIGRVRRGMAAAGELVRRGVVVYRNYEQQPQFFFTDLNAVKPAMIAEATRNAREAAEQFARDSGATVGAIERAQQGLFTIEDRDAFTPEIKRIRVVSTISFYLTD